MRLLTPPRSNPKTAKSAGHGWWTAILHLAPARLSGREVCPHRTPGCTAACLNTAGRGQTSSVQRARIARTQAFLSDRAGFMRDLVREIRAHRISALRRGLRPSVRLNGTSDLRWENISPGIGSPSNLMELFPDVEFYDYTKFPFDSRPSDGLPDNYTLVYSRGETPESDNEALYNLLQHRNVAAVFRTSLPERWNGWLVVDGDTHDVRISETDTVTDPSITLPVVVGLRAKGRARHDLTGFTIQGEE